MTTSQYLDGTYLQKVPDWHVGDSRWKASHVYRMIEKHRLAVRTVYDVGCGAGEVLAELQRRMSPEVAFTGFDISPQAVELANSRSNDRLRFRRGTSFEPKVKPADLLLVLDVLEHVQDYLGFLDALKVNASWVIVHIPLDISVRAVITGSSWMMRMRKQYGHLHYFTRETALACLADAGYQIIDYCYTDDFEISKSVIPRTLSGRIGFNLRKLIYWMKPELAASLFSSYNLLILAHGDRVGTSGSQPGANRRSSCG